MPAFNQATLVGNITRDPEMRYTPSGKNVVSMCVAVSEKWGAKTGEIVENQLFIDVEVWGKLAENCVSYLKRGSLVLVAGRLKLDTWEHAGEKRSKIRLVADRVQFLDSREKQQQELPF